MPKPFAARVSACVAALACFAFASAAFADDWKFDADMFEGLHARALGPGVTSGRVSCIDAVPGDRITLWVGTAGGGVWVSKDGATTWKSIFDKPGQPQSIGAVKVSPANPKVVWVGTGETWVRNSVGVGAGIYRTTDGGDSWELKGLEKTERIADIVIDPAHPDTVLVAATGALWNDSPDRGVYRTRDGGKTWDKVLYVDARTGAADLAMDPRDPNTLYASMWTFRRHAWDFISGGAGSGLFKSTDGGSTWKKLSGGLPEGALGRIGVAISPAQPNRVFASVEAKTTAFWRSDDGGEHWTRLNDSNMSVTWRPFYFSRVIADPKNADRVYKCGLNLAVSDDAGKTFGGGGGFGGASYHSDVHAVWIDPRNPEWLILGCDGGLYISQDRAATWRPIANLPVAQFYHVSTDNRWPYDVYGGLQDNGSWMAPSRRSGGIPNRAWINVNGGDGMWAFPDPKDDDIVYSEYQGGEISRTRISTGEAKSIQPPRREGEPRLRYNWNTPLHISPSHDGTMYLGSQFLYRSHDRGDTWERISPDLTTNDPRKQMQEESGGLSIDNSSAENNCTIYSIGESPKDANVVWAGTDDGNLQVTRDGGKTWTNVTKHLGLPPATWISYVSPSPYDAGTCWVTADGHMQGDMSPHVLVTRDYGATFTALGANDLKGHAHVVIQDTQNPALVFAGTEQGLWCSLDGGGRWAQIHAGIPDVPVRDLVIQQREGDLVIATHGRGIYVIDDLSSLRELTPAVLAKDAALMPSRPSVLVIPSSEQRFDGDTDYSGESISEAAAITYYLKKRHLIGDLHVEVLDAKGNVLQRIDGTKRRGLNRVYWAMRLKGPKMPAAANLVPNNYAFVGPRAAAGDYPVRLIRNKDTLTSVIHIVPDPRSTHTADDRTAQVQLVNKLYGMLGDLSYTVGTLKGASEQARARADKLGKTDALGKRLVAYADRLDALRGTLVALREGRLTGEVRLREELGDLYGKVNQYDGRPTESQQAAAARLSRDLEKARTGAQAALGTELGSLNGALAGRKVEAIGVPTRAEFDAQ
jgi:photosystem II stability/assembly factor-like uncharacterized protein